jgi:2-keto-4-pentenoate hydratase
MAELSTHAFHADTLAEILVGLREQGRAAPTASFTLPPDLASAMQAQTAVAKKAGALDGVFKVAMTPDKHPVVAPLHPYVEGSDVHLPYLVGTRFEVEIAVRLGRDLPVQSAAYARDEIFDAVAGAHLGSELLFTVIEESGKVSFPLYLADRIGNGGYALGPTVSKSLVDTVGGLALKVTVDGIPIYDGPARHPADDVLAWLVDYANDPSRPEGSLTTGTIITTGALSGAMPLPGAGLVEVTLEGGYRMSVTLS